MKLPVARALIVDDELHSQMRLQFALEHAGFQCDLAADGQDALQKIADCRYHVILTELILPNTNGGEFVIKLCQLEARPVVIVHTRTLETDVYRGLKEEGVDAIFTKPADYALMARDVLAVVERCLSPQISNLRWKQWRQGGARAQSEVVQFLKQGDGWIQHSSVRVEAFRFTIIILACVLFGLGWGNSLDATMAGICKMFGLCGFAFYFCLELVAYHRDQYRAKLVRWSAERRLDEHVENRGESATVEPAMTSPAPLILNTAASPRSLIASESMDLSTSGIS